MAESRNLAAVRNLYDGFLRGDFEAALATVDPDVEWVEHFPYRGTCRGPDEIADVFRRVARAFDRYHMTLERFLEAGDMVVVVGRYAVRRRERAEVFESPFVHVYRVRDGRVVRYEGLLDTARARDALGDLALEEAA